MQGMEVLKSLTGVGTTLKGRLLFFDGEEMVFDTVNVKRRPSCPDCGDLKDHADLHPDQGGTERG
jgi:adenylyltransferase/sulfurtransferase